MEKLTPRMYLVFKKIFGVEDNKDLLISLINSILAKQDQVEDLTLPNPYNQQNLKHKDLSTLDIRAKAVDGRRFNIRMHINDVVVANTHAPYFWAEEYNEQLKASGDYSLFSKAIGIYISNCDCTLQENYHNLERESAYLDNLELHTIELDKFFSDSDKELSDIAVKVKNPLDIWAAFLTKPDLLTVNQLPKELDNEELKKALHVLNTINLSQEEKEIYETHCKWKIGEATLKKLIDDSLIKSARFHRKSNF